MATQTFKPKQCLGLEGRSCGTLFTPTSPTHRWCPACGKERERAVHQRHQQAYDRGKGKAARHDICPSCGERPKLKGSGQCAACRDAARRLPPNICKRCEAEGRTTVLSRQSATYCHSHANVEAGKQSAEARWGKGGTYTGKGGWDQRNKRKAYGEKLAKTRPPGTGEHIWQGRRESPNYELACARHMLAGAVRRTLLDEDLILELWPGHSMTDIAGQFGVTRRTVRRNLAELSDRGLISPRVTYPRRALTLAQIEKAQRVVDEAERLAHEARTAGLRDDDGKKRGRERQHLSAKQRYVESVRKARKEARRRGKQLAPNGIIEASKKLRAERGKYKGKDGKEKWVFPSLSPATLKGLMEEIPPDTVPECDE